MKNSILTLLMAALLATTAFAQGPVAAGDLGMYSSKDYSAWALTSNNSTAVGAATMTIRGNGYAVTPGGRLFYPLAVNAPVTVGAGSVAETVTPSAVTCTSASLQNECSFTATFTYAHGTQTRVTSGTFGICEARNDVNGSGTVVLKSNWGGSTSTITSATLAGACDTSSVNILDASAGSFQFYATNGTVYVATSAPLTGSTSPGATVTAQAGTPFIFNAQDTTTNYNVGYAGIGVDTDGAKMALFKTRANNADGRATTTIVTGDDLAELQVFGADGTNYVSTAGILFDSTGTIAATRVPSVIKFYTGTDAAPTVKTLALTLGADQSAVFAGAVTNTGTLTMAGTAVINKTAGSLTLQTTTSGNVVLAPAAAATAAVTTAVRLEGAKGATIDSAGASCVTGDCTLGGDGNFFIISNTTSVDGFATAGWQAGSVIIVETSGSITFNNSGTVAAGFGQLLLVGAANVSMTANDLMMLVYDGTAWNQMAPTLVK